MLQKFTVEIPFYLSKMCFLWKKKGHQHFYTTDLKCALGRTAKCKIVGGGGEGYENN